MTGVLAEQVEHLHDVLGELRVSLAAYCPPESRAAASRALDDLEVGATKLDLALRRRETGT